MRISIASSRPPDTASRTDLEWPPRTGEGPLMKLALKVGRGVILVALLSMGWGCNLARANHYILPCPPDCREDAIPIRPGLTGTWYNTDQAGQGFSIQVLPGQPLRVM